MSQPTTSSPLSFREQLHQSWATWLHARDWQLFITFTFIDNVHPIAAERYLYKFFHLQNIHYYGKSYQKKPACLVWVAGIEYQKRGVVHFHALVDNVPADYRFAHGREQWLRTGRAAGNVMIEKIRTQSDAIDYTTKYVAKEGDMILCPQLSLARECVPSEAGHKIIPLDL